MNKNIIVQVNDFEGFRKKQNIEGTAGKIYIIKVTVSS